MTLPAALAPVRLDADPTVLVAAPMLSLVVYLADMGAWARAGLVDAMRAVLDHDALLGALRWSTSSASDRWQPFSPGDRARYLDALAAMARERPRHQLQCLLAAAPHRVGAAVEYREVDDGREARAGTFIVRLPADAPPRTLVSLAHAVTAAGPFWCAVGGHALSWNPALKSTAWWWAWRWSRRFLGLDVHDPDASSWEATRALPSTSWLTLLGAPLLAAREVSADELCTRPWQHGVRVGALSGGVALVAGEAPTLGDVNALRYPDAYAEVAHALADLLVDNDAELWGGFTEHAGTRAWRRRFLEPEAWST